MQNKDLNEIKQECEKSGAKILGGIIAVIGLVFCCVGVWVVGVPMILFGFWRVSAGLK